MDIHSLLDFHGPLILHQLPLILMNPRMTVVCAMWKPQLSGFFLSWMHSQLLPILGQVCALLDSQGLRTSVLKNGLWQSRYYWLPLHLTSLWLRLQGQLVRWWLPTYPSVNTASSFPMSLGLMAVKNSAYPWGEWISKRKWVFSVLKHWKFLFTKAPTYLGFVPNTERRTLESDSMGLTSDTS